MSNRLTPPFWTAHTEHNTVPFDFCALRQLWRDSVSGDTRQSKILKPLCVSSQTISHRFHKHYQMLRPLHYSVISRYAVLRNEISLLSVTDKVNSPTPLNVNMTKKVLFWSIDNGVLLSGGVGLSSAIVRCVLSLGNAPKDRNTELLRLLYFWRTLVPTERVRPKPLNFDVLDSRADTSFSR